MARRKLSEVERVAREQLGFSALRPGQEEAVRSLLDHRDTLVVQPTGSGKSAIYQAAGLLMEGATIIISPLIALQKDQVDAISSQPHTAEAAVVNSSIPDQQLRETLDYELSPAFAEESDIELLLELLGDDHARHVLYIEVGSRTRRTVEFGEVA